MEISYEHHLPLLLWSVSLLSLLLCTLDTADFLNVQRAFDFGLFLYGLHSFVDLTRNHGLSIGK